MDIEKTIRALTGRGVAVQHFATGREAADYLDGAIDGTTVGIGGSKTIDQIGLYDRLTKHNTVWWHWRTPGFDTLDHALTAPVYLSSANANTADAAALIGEYGIVDAAVAEKALPYCNIVCITGAELLEKLPGYLFVLYNADPAAVGGAMPDNSFYFA